MPVELTDAVVSFVRATIKDGQGRSASVALKEDGIEFYRQRPRQGKKAFVSYERLFEFALKDNPEFFENDQLKRSR